MILVTGATGLLGSRLLHDLVRQGHHVRALKRDGARMSCIENYFSVEEARRIEWVTGDITDVFSLDEALRGITQVYHCAAKVSFQPAEQHYMHHVNVSGTANLVNLCLERNIEKLCYVSSVAALGRNADGELIDESAVWKVSKFNSQYAVSKYRAEQEVWRGVAEGLNAVIVNPGVIIGPGNWKTDSSMLFRQVAKGLKYYTEGITGFVDVQDVSSAMIALMESEIVNERFVLSGENKPFREVMDKIAEEIGKPKPSIYAGPLLSGFAWRMEFLKYKLTGVKPVITKETARAAASRFYYSSEKIKKELGFTFHSIDSAIQAAAKKFLNKKEITGSFHPVSA